MARVTAPLFSLGASGTIADAIVYSEWRGLDYVRSRVIPYNPSSDPQKEVRGVFATLNEMWKRMPALARASFSTAVLGLPLTDRNMHISKNAAILKGATDLDDLVMAVASGAAVPPDSATFTPAAGKITAAFSAPTAPPGYTAASGIFVCTEDGDPSPVAIYKSYAGEDVTSPYSIEISGLAVGVYQCAAIMKWTRDSDLKTFYSAAVRGKATVAS